MVLQSELGTRADDPAPSLAGEQRSLRTATIALILLAGLLSAVVLTWSVFHSRTLELSKAAITTSNTAHTLADHANSSFKMADTVLVSLVDTVEVEGWDSLRTDRLRKLMVKHIGELPALQGLFIYDENGSWIVNSSSKKYDGRNNSDRAYFQFHKHNRSRDVHIGSPIVGRTSGIWVIPVSRRIEHADGSFAGVALATIKVDFFRRVYENLEIGHDWQIRLALNNGSQLLQVPFVAHGIGRDIASHAAFRLQASQGFANRTGEVRIDGATRLVSYAPVGAYPTGILILRSKDEVLRPWLQSTALAYLALALLIGGLLTLGKRVLRQFRVRDHLERQLLSTKAELEAANASLTAMAYIDGLTDLFNRRYFEQAFERVHRGAYRKRTPVAALMIDVDFFKKFNDRYGHPMGDDCLRTVALDILGGMRRSGDFAARYGGEEFIVILPDTDLGGARTVAETIRAAVQDRAIDNADSPHGVVTVSIGICAGIPQDLDGAGAALVAGADAALYQAKAAGRNCTRA